MTHNLKEVAGKTDNMYVNQNWIHEWKCSILPEMHVKIMCKHNLDSVQIWDAC